MVEAELKALGEEADAIFLQRFFRTGPGEYGEGDRFLGVRVPVLRRLARSHRGMPLPAMLRLPGSPFHEARLLALFLMVVGCERGDAAGSPSWRRCISSAAGSSSPRWISPNGS